MKRAQDARRDAPTERTGIAAHFDFGDGSLLQFDNSLTSAIADYASEEFAQVRVVAHQQDGILAGILFQHLLKV
jgi:hypothetical protein